jgi:putative ABC transport system substrate-binding protein
MMRRRDFMLTLAGATLVSPLAAWARTGERAQRVDVLMLYGENDPEGQARATAFSRQLERLGWALGGDLQVAYRWGTGDSDWIQSVIAASLASAPDVIVANGSPAARATQRATRSVPVVFIGSGDPVADGFVQSLAHPGGNMTGFTTFEASLGAKLLGLLKEAAPRTARVAVLVNPESPTGRGTFGAVAAAAQKLDLNVDSVAVRNPADIEAAIDRFSAQPGGGLIIPADPVTNAYRELIARRAVAHGLPAVYALRAAVVDGGLLSYGVDIPELFRKAAAYVDRILRGEKPGDLPVQQPTKFELVINLKTAQALGLSVPPSLLAQADEVSE